MLTQKPELKSISQACSVTTNRILVLCKLVKTLFLLLQAAVSINILQNSEFELSQKTSRLFCIFLIITLLLCGPLLEIYFFSYYFIKDRFFPRNYVNLALVF